MRDIINIHIGQAGVQLGEHSWELLCLERGIHPESGTAHGKLIDENSVNGLFAETSHGRFVPRAVFVDTEPSVVAGLCRSEIGPLFNPSNFLCRAEDAANNFARGFNGNRSLVAETLGIVGRLAEASDSLQGFVLTHSLAGGTGAGLGAAVLERLRANFPRKSFVQLLVVPSRNTSSVVVEPYNSVLHVHSTMSEVDCAFMVDNQAMFGLCTDRLGLEDPRLEHANQICAQALSYILGSVSFSGQLNFDLNEFHTNLVPYQRVHFTSIQLSPLVPRWRNISGLEPSVDEVTRELFKPTSRLLSCNLTAPRERFVSAVVLYKGDVSQSNAQAALHKARTEKAVRIVDWNPTSFRMGLNPRPATVVASSELQEVPRSACMLSNGTALSSIWRSLSCKSRMLYSKKAFVHWFVEEGLDLNELQEAQEDVKRLADDYVKLGKPSKEADSSLSELDGL